MIMAEDHGVVFHGSSSQDQDHQIPSFGMMQSSASSSSHASSMLKDQGGSYEMGELDQALFLYFDAHDHSTVQEHKQTLNIFPSQPMHEDHLLSTKGDDLSLLPSTSDTFRRLDEQSMELGKGKDIKTSLKKEEKEKSTASSTSEHDQGPKTPDAKTLRRLAQNREAARKSRIRKKAYIQQLEHSRIKLLQVEHELQRTRTQGMLLNGGEQNYSSDAAVFDMECMRWKQEHHHLVCELQTAVQAQLPDTELRIYVDKCIAHYDEMMNLKNVLYKCDIFHLVSGMWVSPAERCFLWIGGFRPSQIIKIILRHIEPLSEQQILGICSLQQSTQETEEALSQALEALHNSLTETIISDALDSVDMANYMDQMSVAMSNLRNLEGFVAQADNLRHHTIHGLHQMLSTRQAARSLLAMADYFHRLRALSSLWLQARSQTA